MTGVCHQIANRILFAAKSSGDAPSLVDNAEGYEYYAHGNRSLLPGTREMPLFGLLFFGYADYGLDEYRWRDGLARYGEA